jgi:hypothetical protein
MPSILVKSPYDHALWASCNNSLVVVFVQEITSRIPEKSYDGPANEQQSDLCCFVREYTTIVFSFLGLMYALKTL